MVIGPDKGDLPVMRKLCRETGCDVWFPFYPLCMEHCITETYAMVYECYRKMIALYGGGNVSTCGFSSGGALALGIAAHNNAQPEPLPQPRHIVAVSPGEVPWNNAEKVRMQALNERDVSIDYAFMVTVEKIMRHGCENVPDYRPDRGPGWRRYASGSRRADTRSAASQRSGNGAGRSGRYRRRGRSSGPESLLRPHGTR